MEGFNDFFVNSGPILAKKIQNPNTEIKDYMPPASRELMFLSPIEESEIINVVNNFSPKTSTDCNDLSMKTLKYIFPAIIKPFLTICNRSFSEGVFPGKMKLTKIIPVFKSGEKECFGNYRPVALLSQFSKILEKLFSYRLGNFIEKINILNENRYGFRKVGQPVML